MGINTGQAIGVRERPIVDETVVARSALEVHTHEHLRDILRRLHLRGLAGIHHPAPDDAIDKSRRGRLGIHQFPHKTIERQVVRQRAIEPLGDLTPATVDVPRSLIIIAQGVIPKSQPVHRVPLPIAQEPPHQPRPLVPRRVRAEVLDLTWRRNHPDDVEIHPADEKRVIHRLGHRHARGLEVRLHDAVHRMTRSRGRGRQFRPMR